MVNDEAAPTAGTEDAIPPPIGPVASSLLAGIAAARDPLSAELVLCQVFRATQTAMPGEPDGQDLSEMLIQLLDEVIEHAEALASADALALLRVCSVLGPDSTRAAACDSARGLAAAGVGDRPWASLVGRPRLLQAWRYGDIFQEQESVGALFNYAGRDHAVMVLIDHSLGGGNYSGGGWVEGQPRGRWCSVSSGRDGFTGWLVWGSMAGPGIGRVRRPGGAGGVCWRWRGRTARPGTPWLRSRIASPRRSSVGV